MGWVGYTEVGWLTKDVVRIRNGAVRMSEVYRGFIEDGGWVPGVMIW